ncbi:oxalurate catabolism protein HpxZ [Roseococcus sp. DSY-14]|uniref:oxalurate catabolism protein HpxZ n=1 Tax=Roseococcus sp. DSY-14 TaxID=3369650 RepID=UPI00387B9A24
METDIPAVVAEVTAAFERYETALVTNDVATLDALFWRDPRVLRYGATEVLHGWEELAAFRASRPSKGLARTLGRTEIHSFGRDFAVANTTFTREGQARLGRQSQTWVRMPEGWRVVAAHVSWMD